MKIRSITFLIALIVITYPLSLHASWKKLLFADVGYGQSKGFSQTPKGGSIGTTSLGRPTFQEANIPPSFISAWGAGVEHNEYLVMFRYQPLHVSGNTLLTSELYSHAKFLAGGSPFAMHVRYDWYALLFAKKFYFHHNQWVLSPELQGNWIKYHYDFSSSFQSKRAFTLGTLSAGLKLQYHLCAKLWFEAGYQHSLPLNQLILTQANLGFHMPIRISSLTMTPKIGLGYLQIQYQDKQLVPNYIRYTQNLYGIIGVTLLLQ